MHQHAYILNIPFVAAVVTMPWWIDVLEKSSWLAAKVTPLLALIGVILQVWYYVRKHKKL